MHEIVWEFQPSPGRERDFESVYGPTGPWTALFRRDPGYRGTELIAPRESAGWSRTIDRWESAEAYERFRQTWTAAYQALDQECMALTACERAVGSAPNVT